MYVRINSRLALFIGVIFVVVERISLQIPHRRLLPLLRLGRLREHKNWNAWLHYLVMYYTVSVFTTSCFHRVCAT